jgi:hypothetical protein
MDHFRFEISFARLKPGLRMTEKLKPIPKSQNLLVAAEGRAKFSAAPRFCAHVNFQKKKDPP